MTLQPLLSASPAIQIHAVAAIAAFAVGIAQLAGPKGTATHRVLGYLWAATMLIVAAGSFWIRTIDQWHGLSLIHGFSVLVLVSLPMALAAARRHDVCRHRRIMISLFVGALVVAGVFTFAPGRIMHAVFFGG